MSGPFKMKGFPSHAGVSPVKQDEKYYDTGDKKADRKLDRIDKRKNKAWKKIKEMSAEGKGYSSSKKFRRVVKKSKRLGEKLAKVYNKATNYKATE